MFFLCVAEDSFGLVKFWFFIRVIIWLIYNHIIYHKFCFGSERWKKVCIFLFQNVVCIIIIQRFVLHKKFFFAIFIILLKMCKFWRGCQMPLATNGCVKLTWAMRNVYIYLAYYHHKNIWINEQMEYNCNQWLI